MPLTLDLPGLLNVITLTARVVPGIRQAYDFDEWPSRPPGQPSKNNAYHFTGLPGTDGTSVMYGAIGIDQSVYIVQVPMYTVVCSENDFARAGAWIAQYYGGYPETFRARANGAGGMQFGGFIASGVSLLEQPAGIVRQIPDWPGFTGFYIIRWVLTCHIKGAATNTA